jgi:hypothetical protein
MSLEKQMEIYQKAPTFLYNQKGESKFCKEQKDVDQAWGEGWFGPPWMLRDKPPLSKGEYETKAMLEDAVRSDPRYTDCKINVKQTAAECMERVVAFEIEKGILVVESKETEDGNE